MRKVISMFLIFILTAVFTGCSTFNIEVESPSTKTILEGQWEVKDYTSVNEDDVADCSLIGSIASFSNEEVFIFGDMYNNISYKAKVVNGEDYIYNIIGFTPEYFKIEDESVVVVTISANNAYLKEVIVINDNILIVKDDVILNLEKVSDSPVENINDEYYSSENKEGHDVSSGVLLGLKDYGDEGCVYKTLWITYDGKNIESKEIPYILLPRKNGFFKVNNNRTYNEDGYYDNIEFTFLNGNTSEKEETIVENMTGENIEQDITFIGNDYMSVRTVVENQTYNKSWLNTFLIDMNSSDRKTSVGLGTISDQKTIKDLTIPGSNQLHNLYINDINMFTNFAIERKQGRWSFFTLDSQDKIIVGSEDDENTISESMTREIPLRVSKNVSRHDELFIPWQGISNEVPSAIDAISSPNKNMAIIKTKSNLYVYKVNNNKLDGEPELTIPLDGYETVIMAEWAMAEYVGYWTEKVDALLK